MKNCIPLLLIFFISSSLKASDKDSTINYILPDSVKAVQFFAEINVKSILTKKEVSTGIKTDVVTLKLEADKNEREISFEFPSMSKVMATGSNVDAGEKGELSWNYNWQLNETYKLMLSVAGDSAGNFELYSGYAWLAKENKWKLIGTCKLEGRWNTIKDPATFYSAAEKKNIDVSIGQVWCQRNAGSWKNLKEDNLPVPVVNLFSHIDSTEQYEAEVKMIKAAMASGKTDVKENVEGVYYTMMKEGTGKQVLLTDTVTVFYKLNIFNDGSLVEESKDKPATFPLKRLIKGWQLGIPLCKVGGRIKMIIPSSLGYSIRTRSAKIPPNSILVFEVEVIDAKSQL